jgi:hypothetical protein
VNRALISHQDHQIQRNTLAARYTPTEQAALDLVLETLGRESAVVGEFQAPDHPRAASVMSELDPEELEPIALPPQMVDGLVFAIAAAGEEIAIMSRGEDVAHASGEPTLLIGPDGVGKTTLVQRYILARAGIGTTLLGLHVEPVEGEDPVRFRRPAEASRAVPVPDGRRSRAP